VKKKKMNTKNVILATAIATAFLIAAVGSATAYCPVCGETITSDLDLTCDMTCPTGIGLVIGANDITIEGNNHVMDGVTPGDACTGSGAARTGIYNSPSEDEEEHNNIVIRNLTIKNFCNGLFLEGDEDFHVVNNTVENCHIYNNGRNVAEVRSQGIKMTFAYSSTIKNCEVYNNTGGSGCTPPCENGGNGIFLKSGNDNVITNNELYDNKLGGFFCKAKPMRTEISNNHVWGNHMGGIILRCKKSMNSTIEHNNASYNYGTGIFVGGPYNTIRNNDVIHNMNGAVQGLPDTGTNGCGVNFGRDDAAPMPCGSRWNTLSSNEICENEYLDIWERATVRGTNTGDENCCDKPDGWNDAGTTGCTYCCGSDLVITNIWIERGKSCADGKEIEPKELEEFMQEKGMEKEQKELKQLIDELGISMEDWEDIDEKCFWGRKVYYEVANMGCQEWAGWSVSNLTVDGGFKMIDLVRPLAPKQSRVERFWFYRLPGGEHEVEVCADFLHWVSECNETNNCLTKTLGG
jgi:parallel beta-helix repeat protein